MRFENCGPGVTEWCERTGEGSSTIDLCRDCGEAAIVDPDGFNAELVNRQYGNSEPFGGWVQIDCPISYEDEPMSYDCASCGCRLDDDDQ